MKSFRKIVSEVAQPKAGDEKHFKDKHIVTKVDYPVDVEVQFTGGKIAKAPKRRADLAAGEDEKVYEAKKMDPVGKEDDDIDNDGDVDSSDKYLHARRKAISNAMKKEEAELDEVSKSTLVNYMDKSKSQVKGLQKKYNAGKLTPDEDKKFDRRLSGQNTAMNKFHGRAKVPASGVDKAYDAAQKALRKEEVELDEISRDLARSYIRKASAAEPDRYTKKSGKTRASGIELAGKKAYSIGGEPKVRATEEVELDELSKKTLGSYIKKAKTDVAGQAYQLGAKDPLKPKASWSKALGREKHIDKAVDRLTKEEVEQLDELSPNTLHSYIKKATGDIVGRTMSAASPNQSAQTKKHASKLGKRISGITSASGRLADKANMSENAWEEVPMMMRQLSFICMAAEEIMDYLDMAVDPEEWFQNKLAHVHDQMQTLHAYAQGDQRMMSRMDYRMYGEEAELEEKLVGGQKKLDHNKNGKIDAHDFKLMRAKKMKEEVELDEATPTKKAITRALQGMKVQPKEKVTVKKAPWEKNEAVDLDESITKMSHGRLKFHLNTSTPHGSYSNDEMKSERDRRLKSGGGEAYRKAKAGLSEVTQTAMKKTVTFIDPKGHSRTRNVPVKRVDHDEHGQDKIRESVQMLDEAFKAGMVKLKDGGSVILKKEDADLLNKMFKDLSSTNRKKMQEVAMKDKNGFDEILGFAREAL